MTPSPNDASLPQPVTFAPGEKYAGPTRHWQGIPGIERDPVTGRLWAAWYSGGKVEGVDNYVLLVTSSDEGATWSQPVFVIDPPQAVRAFDPVLWLDPLGRLWFFWAQCNNWYDGRGGVWAMVTSTPGSANPDWSRPRRLADGVMMNKPTVTRDGRWLLPSSHWANRGDCGDPTLLLKPAVYESRDQGQSFTLLGLVDHADPATRTCDEHMLVEKNDGSLWMLLRTKAGLGESFSHDGGVTSTPVVPSKIAAPETRFFIRRLNSGRLLLVTHVRFNPEGKTAWVMQRNNLAALLSDDDGKTWPHELMLDARVMVSYPDGTQGADGVIRVIYDRWRMKKKEVLMARFTEADVLAGRLVNPGSRLGMLIDDARRGGRTEMVSG